MSPTFISLNVRMEMLVFYFIQKDLIKNQIHLMKSLTDILRNEVKTKTIYPIQNQELVIIMNIKKNGFTLIELLVVISIIGILMGLLISQLGGVLGSSENTKMQAVLRSWVIQCKSTKTIMGISPLYVPNGRRYSSFIK